MHNPELVDKIARYLAKEVDLDDENFGWGGHPEDPARQELHRESYREDARKIIDFCGEARVAEWAKTLSKVWVNFLSPYPGTPGSSAGTGDVPPAPPASPPEG